MYKATIHKKGYKWFHASIHGRTGKYTAYILINKLSRNWSVGQTIEFYASSEEKNQAPEKGTNSPLYQKKLH